MRVSGSRQKIRRPESDRTTCARRPEMKEDERAAECAPSQGSVCVRAKAFSLLDSLTRMKEPQFLVTPIKDKRELMVR